MYGLGFSGSFKEAAPEPNALQDPKPEALRASGVKGLGSAWRPF